MGGTVPVHQWELTFLDFRSLVEDRSNRHAIAPLMKEWFDYRIIGHGLRTRIVNGNSEPVDPLELHLRIQDDSRFQYQLYQVAQSLWRLRRAKPRSTGVVDRDIPQELAKRALRGHAGPPPRPTPENTATPSVCCAARSARPSGACVRAEMLWRRMDCASNPEAGVADQCCQSERFFATPHVAAASAAYKGVAPTARWMGPRRPGVPITRANAESVCGRIAADTDRR